VPATSTPVPTVPPIRPIADWTIENPGTVEEVEAELEKHRGESFIFTSWGGAYQGAQRNAWLNPFRTKFGIEIIEDSPMNYAKIRAMAEAGNPTWNIVDNATGSGYALGLAGALEVLDRRIVSNDDYMEVLKNPWGGGGVVTWGYNIAFSLKTYPAGGPQPATMADFYDKEKFPGRRGENGKSNQWRYALRWALMAAHPEWLETAEGRARLTRLSPEEIDEGYEFMRAHRDVIDISYTGPGDCPSLLLSGELDMCSAPGGRFYAAIQQGADFEVCWKCGHQLFTQMEDVVKGVKDQDPVRFELIQLYLAWVAFPENNVRLSQFLNYGPGVLSAIPLLAGPEYDASRSYLPSSANNIAFAIIVDDVNDATIDSVNVDRWVAYQLEE
jgi:putative spermidine/putrescine transport system substrate-binding protein